MLDIGILVGVGGLVLAMLTFVIGRQTSAKVEGRADGATLATIQADIKFVREKVTELSSASDKHDQRLEQNIHWVTEKIESNTRLIAAEIKDHVQKYHAT